MRLSPEILNPGALGLSLSRIVLTRWEPDKAWRSGRGRRTRHTLMGVPQEPGRHCRLRAKSHRRGPVQQPQAPGRRTTRLEGAKQVAAGAVPRSEGNRAGGTGGSGRSTFTVPKKQGNRPEGSLRREGGCREAVRLAGPAGPMDRRRDRWTAHRGRETSQRNFCG